MIHKCIKTVIDYCKLHLKICKEYAILVQFKLKKFRGTPIHRGIKTELKHI